MNTQSLLCLTGLMGFVPAMALLYYLLDRYDVVIKDQPLFGFFAGGIIIGMVAFVAHAFIDNQTLEFLDLAVFVFVIGFAFFEEFVKYIILYYKKFVGKYETTYLGLSLGLGFGATAILSFSYIDIYQTPEILVESPLTIPMSIAYSLGAVGMHGTAGGLIGYGSAKKVRWTYLGMAIGLHVLFNFLSLAFWWSGSQGGRFSLTIILAIIGMAGIMYFKKEIMTKSLPRSLARKRRRMLRAGKRGLDRRKARQGVKKRADSSEE
jgi:RsiW-degrading membrane proteinase PrsW (M82 family)